MSTWSSNPVPVGCTVLCLGVLVPFFVGCGPSTVDPVVQAPPIHVATDFEVQRFCGACHVVPDPATFPQEFWPEKVTDGFEFYRQSGRKDLEPPNVESVVAYFTERAPSSLDLPAIDRVTDDPAESLFDRPDEIQFPGPLRAVANLAGFESDSERFLLTSDMRSGQIWRTDLQETVVTHQFAECLNPCRIEPVDFGAHGAGYLVSDLGSFFPEDHTLGGVWFARSIEDGSVEMNSLLVGVGRVADARPADFDGDGDTDVIVAEFGWRKTGSITLLRNDSAADGDLRVTPVVIDNRHGATMTPIIDIDNDGDLDFIVLLSQEFEEIDAYINQGDGTFVRELIFANDNPGFGSSNLELSDIDSDGDLDLAFVNGDSLDTPIAKPYHGVRWLENTGTFPFVVHELGCLPGAHCVRAGDIDGDGDVDLAVVSLLPDKAVQDEPPGTFDSVCWFEQQETGQFVRHRLEADKCVYAVCELFDWNGDGDLDLIVGAMERDLNADRPLLLFRNRTAGRD